MEKDDIDIYFSLSSVIDQAEHQGLDDYQIIGALSFALEEYARSTSSLYLLGDAQRREAQR